MDEIRCGGILNDGGAKDVQCRELEGAQGSGVVEEAVIDERMMSSEGKYGTPGFDQLRLPIGNGLPEGNPR